MMKVAVVSLMLLGLLTAVFIRGDDGDYDFETNDPELKKIRENCYKNGERETLEANGLRQVADSLNETIHPNGDVGRRSGVPSIVCDFDTSYLCGYVMMSEGTYNTSWEWTNNISLDLLNIKSNVGYEKHDNNSFLVATILDWDAVITVTSSNETLVEAKYLRFSYIGNGFLNVTIDMIGGLEGWHFDNNVQPSIWQAKQINVPAGSVRLQFNLEVSFYDDYSVIGIDNIELLDGPCINNSISSPVRSFPCLDSSRCIDPILLCDQYSHCFDDSDETERRCRAV